MRALITFGFVLFLVMSVLVFALFLPWSIYLLPVWAIVALPIVGSLCVVWLKDERPRFLPSDIYSPVDSRHYKNWNSIYGWPREPNLFYECGLCHKTLPSQTDYPRECACGNLFITPDHIGAQNPTMVRLYEE